ncbi:hypothetical protein [Cupriavidus basilensis]|uniref:hypothetical protein n=1 Tax=Cupriavidus basilensis TaxID=68895 RepID=UPI00067FA576|nr:hypothetical protein [Cupriavidus basilensis]
MQPKALEPTESVVLALLDSVREWQRVLDQTLSDAGLDYPKWILLRAIRQQEFVRHEPYLGPMLISATQSESLLDTLHAGDWIAYDPAGQPFIPVEAEPRVDRVWKGLKALHSVSVAPFSAEERSALTASLRRMKDTLRDHSLRLGRQAERRVEPTHEGATASSPSLASPHQTTATLRCAQACRVPRGSVAG